MTVSFEWPKGSGRVAEYEPHEARFVKAVLASYERVDITGAEMKNQVEFIHEAKLMGARMLTRQEEIARGYRVEGHGEFQIPESLQLVMESR